MKIVKKMSIILILIWGLSLRSEEVKYGSLAGNVKASREDSSTDPSNVVIYLTGFDEAPLENPIRLEQKDRKFTPTVSVITRGQQVEFLNNDKVKHNIFSMSTAKQFDIGEMSEAQSAKVEFKNTGIVDLYCNIHPKMNGVLLVVPNRAFAITDKTGNYRIDHIPIGEYPAFAWHSLASPQKRVIKILPNLVTAMDWKVELTKEEVPHLNKAGKAYPTDNKPADY